MSKAKLRNNMLHQLKNLKPQYKAKIEASLREQLFQTSIWKQSNVIGMTYSQSFEWDTTSIMKRAWQEKKVVALPKSNDENKQLQFYKVSKDSPLQIGYGGILEPYHDENKQLHKHNIDLLIVPGLLFDEAGYRIGYGGGFYDRYLQDFPNKTLALASDRQLIEKLKHESHDIPVQMIVTETHLQQITLCE